MKTKTKLKIESGKGSEHPAEEVMLQKETDGVVVEVAAFVGPHFPVL